MNFLADENIDRHVVKKLRSDGHTVLYVIEMEPGIPDDEVLDEANKNKALLLTADKDFGELVYRLDKVHLGVVLVRLAGLSPSAKSEVISSAISSHGPEFSKAFTVISHGMIRIRGKNKSQT